MMRRSVHVFRVLVAKLIELAENFRRLVERFPTLGLRRLEHEGLMYDEREVHCGRMHAIVDERLGDIQRGDTGLLLELAQIENCRKLDEAVKTITAAVILPRPMK